MTIRDRIVELRRVKASELLPNPRNWRRHPKEQSAALKGLLQEIGYAGALLARELPDGKLMLIDGHLRRDTTPKSIVPVLVLDVTEAEADKILLTFDPLSAMAQADKSMIDELLKTVQTESEAVGALLERVAGQEGWNAYQPKEIVQDEVPDKSAALQKKWGTKIGQLWEIGEHRLMCGDSTQTETYQHLLPKAVALISTSPPYTDQRTYKIGTFDWLEMMKGATSAALGCLSNSGHALFVLGPSHKERAVDAYWQPWIEWCEKSGHPLFGWYVWDKGSGMPGDWSGRLAPAHEFIFHFNAVTNQAHKWIKTLGGTIHGTRRQVDGTLKPLPTEDVLPFKVPDSVIRIVREMHRGLPTQSHPAVYPVELPAFFMQTWTNEAESVLDPFCGSGTTLVAAHQLGRIGYGVEIDPGYVAVTLERLSALGLEPRLLR